MYAYMMHSAHAITLKLGLHVHYAWAHPSSSPPQLPDKGQSITNSSTIFLPGTISVTPQGQFSQHSGKPSVLKQVPSKQPQGLQYARSSSNR